MRKYVQYVSFSGTSEIPLGFIQATVITDNAPVMSEVSDEEDGRLLSQIDVDIEAITEGMKVDLQTLELVPDV